MTSSDPGPPDDGPQYDARSRPRRGVRIKPLPRHHHREFRRLVAEATCYIRSQISTWKLASREIHGERIIQAQLIYWESALRWMSHLEYLGTHNDSRERPGRPRG